MPAPPTSAQQAVNRAARSSDPKSKNAARASRERSTKTTATSRDAKSTNARTAAENASQRAAMERADRVSKAADDRDTRDAIAAQKAYEKTKAQEADATRYTKGTPNAAAFKAKEIQIAKDVGKGLRPFSDLSPAARQYGAPGSNKQRIGTILEKRGFNEKQIAAMLGNFSVESYNRKTKTEFDPLAVGDSGTARGLGQWRFERQDALRAGYGDNWKTVEAQANFAADELQGVSKNRDKRAEKAMEAMQNPDASVSDMTRAFMKDFERPTSDPQKNFVETRVANANKTFEGMTRNTSPNVQVADATAPTPKQKKGSAGDVFEKKVKPTIERAIPDLITKLAPSLPGVGPIMKDAIAGDAPAVKSGITGLLDRLLPAPFKSLSKDIQSGDGKKAVKDGFNTMIGLTVPPVFSDVAQGVVNDMFKNVNVSGQSHTSNAGAPQLSTFSPGDRAGGSFADRAANDARPGVPSSGSGTATGPRATVAATAPASSPSPQWANAIASVFGSSSPALSALGAGATFQEAATLQNAAYVADGATFQNAAQSDGAQAWEDAGKNILANEALPSLYSVAWVIVALALIIVGIIVMARKSQVFQIATTAATKGML